MKMLIAEDDFVARRIIKDVTSPYGDCDVVVDGKEAVRAFKLAWDEDKPYDLVCLDIMMPNLDGLEALKQIRAMEKELGIRGSKEVKVIMTTALDDPKTVFHSFYRSGATSYLVKPITRKKIVQEMMQLGLLTDNEEGGEGAQGKRI
jgi:two-component system, chemotaxis family, chemotaxis protein CheY